MATTQEIVQAAEALGKLIAGHPAAQRFEAAVQKLQQDSGAQRVLTDFNRMVEKLGQKEAAGQPIEVPEKRELERLRGELIRTSLLQELQVAQMDYVDLMRQVDEAMGGKDPLRDEGKAGKPPLNAESL
jgi:cell fate (sporulation/competence/biofilm development) regulator YlbF (YheA/YmcA/DUF963 family)